MANFLGKSVIDCYHCFEQRKIFAPYFALLQSSGTGKTTCMGLIENLFPTRYFNFRFKKNYNRKYDEKYLSKLKIIAKIEDEEVALQQMQNLLLTCVINLEKPQFFSGHKESKHFSESEYLSTGIRCICIDEAKVLYETPAFNKKGENRNVFELLRKALGNLTSSNKIILVVADTVLTVAKDLSLNGSLPHIREKSNPNLYPVVFHMPFSDLKIPEVLKNDFDSNKPEFSLARLSLYGRPLWSNKEKRGLLTYIENKLVRQTNDDFQKHMAVLGSRLALQIEGDLAEQLVANSLAHCVHISPCRKLVRCIFQSEPLVSEVATNIMNRTLEIHVYSLLKSFLSGTIAIGRTGEILAQFILLLAHDRSYKVLNDIIFGYERITVTESAKPVPLSSLFELLVHDFDSENVFFTRTVEDNNDIKMEYLCVFFNHFIELSKGQDITVDLLNKRKAQMLCFSNKRMY